MSNSYLKLDYDHWMALAAVFLVQVGGSLHIDNLIHASLAADPEAAQKYQYVSRSDDSMNAGLRLATKIIHHIMKDVVPGASTGHYRLRENLRANAVTKDLMAQATDSLQDQLKGLTVLFEIVVSKMNSNSYWAGENTKANNLWDESQGDLQNYNYQEQVLRLLPGSADDDLAILGKAWNELVQSRNRSNYDQKTGWNDSIFSSGPNIQVFVMMAYLALFTTFQLNVERFWPELGQKRLEELVANESLTYLRVPCGNVSKAFMIQSNTEYANFHNGIRTTITQWINHGFNMCDGSCNLVLMSRKLTFTTDAQAAASATTPAVDPSASTVPSSSASAAQLVGGVADMTISAPPQQEEKKKKFGFKFGHFGKHK